MTATVEYINNNLKELVGLFHAQSFGAVVTKSEFVLKQLEDAKVKIPPGLFGLYAISLFHVGNIEGSIKAFSEEKSVCPESTVGGPILSLAKQIHASRIGGRASYLENYSDSAEGKTLTRRVWDLMQVPQYKVRVADNLARLGRENQKYAVGAAHNEQWIDLLLAAEWVIDFYSPFKILVIGDVTNDVESYIKVSSPYSSVHQIAGEKLLERVTEHLTSQDYKNRLVDLILITNVSSKRDRVELFYRVMPFLSPSGFLVGADSENGDTRRERSPFKLESLDTIFGESDEGYFFTARSPQTLLLAQVS